MKRYIAVRKAQLSADAHEHARHQHKARKIMDLQQTGPISIGRDAKHQAVKILLLDGIIYTCKLRIAFCKNAHISFCA